VERAYMRIHKGPAESRSELCLSLAKTPRPLNVIHGTCDTASSYVIDFRCVLDFGEGQPLEEARFLSKLDLKPEDSACFRRFLFVILQNLFVLVVSSDSPSVLAPPLNASITVRGAPMLFGNRTCPLLAPTCPVSVYQDLASITPRSEVDRARFAALS